MKISKTFKKAIATAAKQLVEDGRASLNHPFQDNFVTLEKPLESDSAIEMKFRDLNIDRDGNFFLVMKVM
jgi:hypothetical protein